MSEFGDIDPEDVYAADGEPDPLQLAIRLHNIRKYLADVNGQPFPAWDDLTPDEQHLAVAIFVDIVAWLRRQGTIR